MRRAPLQARSRERVRLIVDAAAVEFATAGYDAATTEAIAARAKVPIGSVYQFFSNKQALFEAVTELGLERARHVFETEILPELPHRGWRELLELTIDRFYEHQKKNDAFRAIASNLTTFGVYPDAGQALHTLFIETALPLVALNAPGLAREQQRTIAFVVVQTITAMLFAAHRAGPGEGKRIVQETKTMLLRYLDGYVAEVASQ